MSPRRVAAMELQSSRPMSINCANRWASPLRGHQQPNWQGSRPIFILHKSMASLILRHRKSRRQRLGMRLL